MRQECIWVFYAKFCCVADFCRCQRATAGDTLLAVVPLRGVCSVATFLGTIDSKNRVMVALSAGAINS